MRFVGQNQREATKNRGIFIASNGFMKKQTLTFQVKKMTKTKVENNEIDKSLAI